MCRLCRLRFHADQPSCPRCKNADPGQPLPGYEFAGFLASKNESPILDEEERYAERNLVRTYPQWDGSVAARFERRPELVVAPEPKRGGAVGQRRASPHPA